MQNNSFSHVQLRHWLHQHPELSGREFNTIATITEFIGKLHPDQTIKPLAGTGAAFIFEGKDAGPVIVVRADTDAVATDEINNFEYHSVYSGASHLCGHDGHTAILAGLACNLANERIASGKVVLLFQPAEETGAGAKAVLADPAFISLNPDCIIGLHNLPGFDKHEIILRRNVFASASKGVEIKLFGRSAHAAYPETGISPVAAIAELIESLNAITSPLFENYILLTIVHAKVGERSYGIAPGFAEIHATLRAFDDRDMDLLVNICVTEVCRIAAKYRLQHQILWHEEFPATLSNEQLVELALQAASAENLKVRFPEEPFRWSEDFGYYTSRYKTLFFGLGAGSACAPLHDPEYDFPDDIIPTGIRMFRQLINRILLEKELPG
jgi:amidohydrolase